MRYVFLIVDKTELMVNRNYEKKIRGNHPSKN